jgi:hypothetical protein
MNNEYYCKGCLADENQMEKRLTSIRAISERKGKTKFCAHCGSVATQEALFEVEGGVTLIERYCDICAKKVK